jgi:hypothetical protein
MMQKNGQPNATKIPNNNDILGLQNHGLAVRATPDCEIKFGRNWSAERCEQWLRELLPAPFSFNNNRNETAGLTNKSVFVLLSREQKKLAVVAVRHPPSGQEFFDFKGRPRAGVQDSKIFFSSSGLSSCTVDRD